MILNKKQLQTALNNLAKHNSLAAKEQAKIYEHCEEVYGVTPSDIDNDEFIDSCCGGCGVSDGMSVEEFNKSMEKRLKLNKP